MPDIIAVGPLSLDGRLLTALLAGAAGWLSLVWRLRQSAKRDEESVWLDPLLQAALLVGLCWKFGFLLQDVSLLWERPLSLLVMRGTAGDAALGAGAAALYLLWISRRRCLSLRVLGDLLPYAILPGMLAWQLLTQFPYQVPYAAAVLLLYLLMLRVPASDNGSLGALRLYLLGLGLGCGLVSLFIPLPPGEVLVLTLGLTSWQWLLLVQAVCGSFINRVRTAAKVGPE